MPDKQPAALDMTEDAETSVVELLRNLIAIDSVNPDLVPGGAGEAAVAHFAADWLTTRGFQVRLLQPLPGRVSVLATASGTGGGTSIMLNGHLDTVALSTYHGDGLAAVERDGCLFGRGAYDMKSGIAAMMVAATTASAHPHRGDIVLALVADEEWASTGTEEVLRHTVTDTAVVVEPSGLDLVVAHRGFVWVEVAIHGRAAHGSRPDLGIDAITKAGSFLTAIDRLGHTLAAGDAHPLLGTGSVHASTITGGTEASSYPDRCTIVLERRTIPGEDAHTVENEIRTILDNLAQQDSDFAYDLAITAHREPFAAHPDSLVTDVVAEALQAVTGATPRRRGEPFWTECALLADAGIDTVLVGVDGGGAHAATEWVTLDSLTTLTHTLIRTIDTVTATAHDR